MTPDQLFGILSDQTRLRCLILLLNTDELCVCEIIEILKQPQSKISRHLSLLRNLDLVNDERRGNWIYYKINPDLTPWIKEMLLSLSEKILEQKPFSADLEVIRCGVKGTCC